MKIKNINIVNADKTISGWIEIEHGKIKSINSGDCLCNDATDGKGRYLLPRYFDSHTHGGHGYDVNLFMSDPDQRKIDEYLLGLKSEGVGSVMLTSVTCPPKDFAPLVSEINKMSKMVNGSLIKGFYVEGPYINPKMKGAHSEQLIVPIQLDAVRTIRKTLGSNLKLIVAVAPEYEDNMSKLKELTKYATVTIAHSSASYDEVMQAKALGASRITHLFNQTSSFKHRELGIANYVLHKKDIYAELICDYKHVDKIVVETLYNVIGADRIIVVSDSLLTKASKDKYAKLGDLEVEVRDSLTYLRNSDKIAGSCMPYNIHVSNFKKATNCSMNEIVKVSSLNSAQNLGLKDGTGTISVGLKADFNLVDENCNLIHVYEEGKIVF